MSGYRTGVCKFSGVAVFKSNKKKLNHRVIIKAPWLSVTSLEKKLEWIVIYEGDKTERIYFNYIKIYKSNPITGLERPWGFQEFEALRFQENRHTKVVRLSAIRTGRLYPQ